MLQIALRSLVGLSGLAALAMAVRFWIDPAGPAAQLGVGPLGDLGVSTLRADMGAFFGVAGGFAVAAALRNDARLILPPLFILGAALLGRLFTATQLGFGGGVVEPIVVEAVLTGLYAAAWFVLGRRA